MSIKPSRYFQPIRSYKKPAMGDEPSSSDGQTLKIIGGVVAGAAFLALFGTWYTSSNGVDKTRCLKVLKEDTPPCLHISPGNRRNADDEGNVQQVSNTIPPSKTSKSVETVPPVTEPLCLPTLRERTPPARCEPVLNDDGGEPNKSCDKPKKPCAKPAPKPQDLRLPYGCGERVPKVEPNPVPCKEIEEPAVTVIEKPRRQCKKRACVSIDPSRRRWPDFVGGEAAEPKPAAVDSKFTCDHKCDPLDPKPFAKSAPKPHELNIPYGCEERVPKVEPIPMSCKEIEEPLAKVIEKPRRSKRRACVGIDPSRRRWPDFVGGEAAAPKPAPVDSCYNKCEPLDPKPCAKSAPKPQELHISYLCGELVPKVEPSISCKDIEEPVVKVIEKRRRSKKRACVGIDPSRLRWPEFAGGETAAPKPESVDSKSNKCES